MRSVSLILTVAICVSAAHADDLPPGVMNTQNPDDVPLTPEESLARITVPDGFHVTLFAGEPDVRRPIAFDFDDRGRLWVVENYSHPEWREDGATDRILILEDTDHDGRMDRRKVYWDKGRYLSGIAVGHGGVWIGNTPELSFIPDRDGDDIPDSEPVVMLDGFTVSPTNVLNNFHWGPDGWLYGALGLAEESWIGKPGTPHDQRTRITRGIWRYHPIHGDFEVLADGMVNPWGADFNAYGDLLTTNTVIAHLWHIVPGMYCERRVEDPAHRYVYGRIQSITDHLHWGGGAWHSSRESDEHHSVAGGGHAHCGAMIYLADNWPEKYRGTLFTNNLHGNRVNNDRLVPHGSTYVGVHGEDFLFGNDPWFRGLSVKYGPDGGVYISDWHDLGECHDQDGSHRSSGRIFKVVYGQPEARSTDLAALSDLELAKLHAHFNEWFVRHARRLLHERSAAGEIDSRARQWLATNFDNAQNEQQKLRSLWTRYVIGDLNKPELKRLMGHDNQHVRRWAVRFAVDRTVPNEAPDEATVEWMAIMAAGDRSPKVRLALACSLQKLPLPQRWQIARGLMSHAEDAEDPYLPLMIWYGVEPLVTRDMPRALQAAVDAKIPLLRRYIARRALDVEQPAIEQVMQVALGESRAAVRLDLLQGALDALEARDGLDAPPCWAALYDQVRDSSNPALRSAAVRLATIFGDQEAIERLRQTAMNANLPDERRRDAFRAILSLEDGVPVEMLHRLIAQPSVLRRDAIQALAQRNDATTAKLLLDLYPGLSASEQQDAIGVLVTRQSFAETLLAAIEHGTVDRGDVSAFALQQLRAYPDDALNDRVATLWADDTGRLESSAEIARFKQLLTPEYLAQGNAGRGRVRFEQTCSKCHSMFGEGGNIGPELTGSDRKNLDYVLTNLFDPALLVDEAFRLTTIATVDGRILSGFIVQHAEHFVIVQTPDAQVRLEFEDIDQMQTTDKSMMPEGMLRGLSDGQIRDLLVYLASPRQVALPAGDEIDSAAASAETPSTQQVPPTIKHSSSQPALEEFRPRQDTLPVDPPEDATLLFGEGTNLFLGKDGGPPNWPVVDGALVSTSASTRSNHLVSKLHFRDADVHVEFMVDEKASGNSGVYLHGQYELQILDSFGNDSPTMEDIGAVYRFAPPRVNAARPAGQWQVYDIRYRAPRRDAHGEIAEPGTITAWLNGQKVQDETEVGEPRSPYHPFRYKTTPYLDAIAQRQLTTRVGPVFLQDHDSPARFRNVWIRPLDDTAFLYEPPE
ncbi:MAG: PVC-type heme-binding CxxCH protein [Pirellulales bacterium]